MLSKSPIEKDSELFDWGQKFKYAFMTQDRLIAEDIFDKDFGFHNGKNKEEYIEYEMKEFFLKKDKFSLKLNSNVVIYELKDNFFYYSIGNHFDRNVFEAVFQYLPDTKKAIGNQYPCPIETKSQAILEYDNWEDYKSRWARKENIQYSKRINLFSSPLLKVENIKKVVCFHDMENYYMQMNHLESHLGGSYLSIMYDNKETKSLFQKVKIFGVGENFERKILFKNFDHPHLINNLFATIVQKKENVFRIHYNTDIIINILNIKTNKNDYFYKYPEQYHIDIELKKDEKIEFICVTDTLSLDWIIRFKNFN